MDLGTEKTGQGAVPCSKMVLRLWLMMMALVLLCVASLWAGQLVLFEKNYVQSAISELKSRMEPISEDLKTEDLAQNGSLLPNLSKTTNGKVLLTDEGGKLLELYTYGHALELEVADRENKTWGKIRESPEYRELLTGEDYQKISTENGAPVSFEIGIPVRYNGQSAYVILFTPLNELQTVLRVNRRQLIALSFLLTFAAAALAAVLARRFVKPILMIKRAVDRLAQGDYTATPGVCLKDEIGLLSQSVEALGRALQRVDVLRREVIANVSHELRSPLALIAGYAEMVRDVNWKDDVKRREDLDLIIQEARRMSEMVSDILDYSQFQAGFIQLKKDWYNLYDIVESETALCGQSAGVHGIRLLFTAQKAHVPVYADALKLSQVIRNLLYNAINHTDDGETITVALESAERLDRVSVANPGSPIPEEERKLIWERYQRSQHQGSRRQGTGLGLSIVSTILNAHGMCYGVDCRDGLTVFWFGCPKEEDAQDKRDSGA